MCSSGLPFGGSEGVQGVHWGSGWSGGLGVQESGVFNEPQ